MNHLFFPLAQESGSRQFIDNLARTPQSHIVVFVAILTVLRIALFPYLKSVVPHLRGPMYRAGRVVNELLDAIIYAAVFVFLIIRPFAVQAFLVPSGSMWSTLLVGDYIVANKFVYRFSNPRFQDIVVFRPPRIAVYPSQLDANGDINVDFVKRCIGLPGDLIEIKKGQLYRNGTKIDEPYIHYSFCSNPSPSGEECQDFTSLTDPQIADMTKASFKLVSYHGAVIPFNYTDRDGNAAIPDRKPGDAPPYDIASEFQIQDPATMNELMSAPAQRIPPGHYLMMGDNRNQSFDGRGWGLIDRDAIVGRSEFVWLPLSDWHLTR